MSVCRSFMARPLWILCLQHHKYTTTPRRHVPASQTKHTHTHSYTQTVPNRQRNNFKKCQKGIIQKMSEKATPRKATTATPLSPRTSGWEEHTHTQSRTPAHTYTNAHPLRLYTFESQSDSNERKCEPEWNRRRPRLHLLCRVQRTGRQFDNLLNGDSFKAPSQWNGSDFGAVCLSVCVE